MDPEFVSALNEQAAEADRQSMVLTQRIGEIAQAVAPDYPNVATAPPLEQLYAIESSCTGTEAANKDLHVLIDRLQEKLGWTALEVVEFWETSQATPAASEPKEGVRVINDPTPIKNPFTTD